MEAVNQGSATIVLKSKTHAILLALKVRILYITEHILFEVHKMYFMHIPVLCVRQGVYTHVRVHV